MSNPNTPSDTPKTSNLSRSAMKLVLGATMASGCASTNIAAPISEVIPAESDTQSGLKATDDATIAAEAPKVSPDELQAAILKELTEESIQPHQVVTKYGYRLFELPEPELVFKEMEKRDHNLIEFGMALASSIIKSAGHEDRMLEWSPVEPGSTESIAKLFFAYWPYISCPSADLHEEHYDRALQYMEKYLAEIRADAAKPPKGKSKAMLEYCQQLNGGLERHLAKIQRELDLMKKKACLVEFTRSEVSEFDAHFSKLWHLPTAFETESDFEYHTAPNKLK